MIDQNDTIELRSLTQRIENNSATLSDYQRYQDILTSSGLSADYVLGYLRQSGFNSWEDFVSARNRLQTKKDANMAVVGGLVGIGLAVLLNSLQEN